MPSAPLIGSQLNIAAMILTTAVARVTIRDSQRKPATAVSRAMPNSARLIALVGLVIHIQAEAPRTKMAVAMKAARTMLSRRIK